MVDIHEQFNSRQKTRIPVLPIKAANFFQLVQKLWHIRNYKRKSTGEKGNKQQNKAKQNLFYCCVDFFVPHWRCDSLRN